jgi:hypothetical protein
MALIQRYAPMAVGTLVKVMNETTASASAKVTAAGSLLKFGRDGIELDDLAERVELLERHIVTVKPQESGNEPREADSKS